MTALTGHLRMIEADWAALPGDGSDGTNEAAWLVARTTKVSFATRLAGRLAEVAEVLKARNATFHCSADLLSAFPYAAYWYVCLAGLPMKTLGNIRRGPVAFGLTRSVKGLVEALEDNGRATRAELAAFSNWVNDELDRLYPPHSRRDALRALIIVSMLAGGRALGQSQNAGGDDAVTLFKTEIVGAFNGIAPDSVQVLSSAGNRWSTYSPECKLAEQRLLRIRGHAVFRLIPGGNRPDVEIYADHAASEDAYSEDEFSPSNTSKLLAVGEIKGRRDLSNAWESWMPQVSAHMDQWAGEFPGVALLFFGTILTREMVGTPGGLDHRPTLRSIHERQTNGHRHLTAAYNLTKIAEKDAAAARNFGELVAEINGL
jgi:hypothetical protein